MKVPFPATFSNFLDSVLCQQAEYDLRSGHVSYGAYRLDHIWFLGKCRNCHAGFTSRDDRMFQKAGCSDVSCGWGSKMSRWSRAVLVLEGIFFPSGLFNYPCCKIHWSRLDRSFPSGYMVSIFFGNCRGTWLAWRSCKAISKASFW